jgi:hypothetical protein
MSGWEPMQITNAIIIVGVPIIIARLIIGLSYQRRQHRFWTFGLPTLALLVLFVRVAVTRRFVDLISPDDWVATISYALVVATQLIAGIYEWWPYEVLARRDAT